MRSLSTKKTTNRRRRARHVMASLAALTIANSTACGSGDEAPAAAPITFKFPIHATTKTVQGEPLPGIPVLLTLGGEDAETKTIGYTDKNGEFKALVNAKHDTPIVLGLNAPDDYNFEEGQDFIDDRLLAKKDEKDPTLVHTNTFVLKGTYSSKQVEQLVWVKLDCPSKDKGGDTLCHDVAIKRGDEILATTDLEGRAHFTIKGVPGETLRLEIENSVLVDEDEDQYVQLEPANPGFNIKINKVPQAFVIHETFAMPEEEEEEKPAAKAPPRKKKRVRKASTKKKTSSSSRKKKSSVELLSGSSKKKSPPAKKKKPEPKKNENGISLF